MNDNLKSVLDSNSNTREYFESLPKYVQIAVDEHACDIQSENTLHLFAETFMRDDSFRGS